MAAKSFLHFGDGTALIGERSVHFQNLTIGIKRNYSARSVGVNLEKLIAVPYSPEILSAMTVSIEGVKYKVEQKQVIEDSFPKSVQFSLSRNTRLN